MGVYFFFLKGLGSENWLVGQDQSKLGKMTDI